MPPKGKRKNSQAKEPEPDNTLESLICTEEATALRESFRFRTEALKICPVYILFAPVFLYLK